MYPVSVCLSTVSYTGGMFTSWIMQNFWKVEVPRSYFRLLCNQRTVSIVISASFVLLLCHFRNGAWRELVNRWINIDHMIKHATNFSNFHFLEKLDWRNSGRRWAFELHVVPFIMFYTCDLLVIFFQNTEMKYQCCFQTNCVYIYVLYFNILITCLKWKLLFTKQRKDSFALLITAILWQAAIDLTIVAWWFHGQSWVMAWCRQCLQQGLISLSQKVTQDHAPQQPNLVKRVVQTFCAHWRTFSITAEWKNQLRAHGNNWQGSL